MTRRPSVTLTQALNVLELVLRGDLHHAAVCGLPDKLYRLIVAHAVMRTQSIYFLEPGTTRLLGHLQDVLALLVGEWPEGAYSLVVASRGSNLHLKAEPGAIKRVSLVTPPEVLALLEKYSATAGIRTAEFLQAACRYAYENNKVDLIPFGLEGQYPIEEDPEERLQRRQAAEIVQKAQQLGGNGLVYAVLAECRRALAGP